MGPTWLKRKRHPHDNMFSNSIVMLEINFRMAKPESAQMPDLAEIQVHANHNMCSNSNVMLKVNGSGQRKNPTISCHTKTFTTCKIDLREQLLTPIPD